MHPGDLDSVVSIENAMDGVDSVFVSLPANPFDTAAEERYGRNVILAAKNKKIKTFVYSTVARTGEHEDFPGWNDDYPLAWYWKTKHLLEDEVRNAGFQYWTILRPAVFMQNFTKPMVEYLHPGLTDAHELRVRYNPDTKLDIVDVRDIARFAAAAIEEPEKFSFQHIGLAAESLTAEQLAEQLGQISGTEIKVVYTSEEEAKERIAAGDFMPSSQAWHRDFGYGVDIEATKRWGIPLTPLSKALDKDLLNW